MSEDVKNLMEKRDDYYREKCDNILKKVPERYRDKLYDYACMQGHSSGYSEVYNYLMDLVEIFIED